MGGFGVFGGFRDWRRAWKVLRFLFVFIFVLGGGGALGGLVGEGDEAVVAFGVCSFFFIVWSGL